jgi:hypothetical protein
VRAGAGAGGVSAISCEDHSYSEHFCLRKCRAGGWLYRRCRMRMRRGCDARVVSPRAWRGTPEAQTDRRTTLGGARPEVQADSSCTDTAEQAGAPDSVTPQRCEASRQRVRAPRLWVRSSAVETSNNRLAQHVCAHLLGEPCGFQIILWWM